MASETSSEQHEPGPSARGPDGTQASSHRHGSPDSRSTAKTAHGPAAETQRRVILATADLIDRLSYRSVTIDAVARASGVSKSTIYRYWPSRQQLVLEAFTHKTDELTAVVDTGDAWDDLRTYLNRLAFCLHFGGAASTVAGLIADAVYDERFAHSLRATMIRSRRREFFAILLRGQQRGQIRPDADVATVVDALYGAVHHRLIVTRQPIDDRFLSALVAFAVSGLQADRPDTHSEPPHPDAVRR